MLDELKRLLGEATAGPFVVIESEPGIDDHVEYAVVRSESSDDLLALGCYHRDARLIAAAVNALPKLLAVCEAAASYRRAADAFDAYEDGSGMRLADAKDALDRALAALEVPDVE